MYKKNNHTIFGHVHSKEMKVLNNRTINSKLHFVYLLCVLIPVIVTNTVIIVIMISIIKNDHQKSLDRIVNVSTAEITNSIENAASLTINLYANKYINNFLTKQYKSSEEYFEEYAKMFNTYGIPINSREYIDNIMICTDNTTIHNGGYISKVSSVSNEPWFKAFKEAKKDLFIYPYYRKTTYENQTNRTFCVIRKLDFYERIQKDKFVKVDMNYDNINTTLESVSFGAKVYFCSDDKILFTNDPAFSNSNKEYANVLEIVNKKKQADRKVSILGNEYRICVTNYKGTYFNHLRQFIPLILLLFFADAILPAYVLKLFSESLTSRILILGSHLERVKDESFNKIEEDEGNDEIGLLIENYNLMVSKMKDLIEYEYRSKIDKQELELARKQAELQALYCQINPHFMFNVLESIRMHSILKGEEETSAMIESLAKLMRKSAEWGNDYITLEHEVKFTQDFLSLQKYRYGDAFTYNFQIEPECLNRMIPSLALVTFVENACVHGLNRTGHAGEIIVSAYEDDDYCNIEIADTGVGMEKEKAELLEEQLNNATIDDLQHSKSLGMLNASIRLKKFCSDKTMIKIESNIDEGTCITIKIPLIC